MKCVVVALLLIVASSALGQDRNSEDLRLIAARVTQTAIIVTTTTTSVPTTCALTIQTSICGGGRRRRSVRRFAQNIDARHVDLVEPSMTDGSSVEVAKTPNVDDGDAKLQITVWTLTTSTYTLTSISTQQTLGRLVSESFCEREDPGSNPAAAMVDAARITAWDLGNRIIIEVIIRPKNGPEGETVSSLKSTVVSSSRVLLPEDARLLAAQSRKTITTVTTSTMTAPVICNTAINTEPCGKRRRRANPLRRSLRELNKEIDFFEKKDLDSSLDLMELPLEEKRPRLSYTVWWTHTSTLTHISTVNSGVTLSLSYFCSFVGGRESVDLRVIAARSTLTAISITSTTTTVPYTCYTAIDTAICRKRRSRNPDSISLRSMFSGEPNSRLDSSVNERFSFTNGDESTAQQRPKLAFTLWTTSTSPFTYTITSTNAAVTFSVSFMCTFPGQFFPPACG
ncbi:hypothetical protein FHG87_011513 [Trinorchestia longiramus]|nr:hypothetical protein FHG87_011513 [Trinorchestia longiramus]